MKNKELLSQYEDITDNKSSSSVETEQLNIDIDPNKPTILFIDDEVRILRSLKMIFRKTHNVFTTSDPEAFRRLIREQHIHVIVCDQKMPKVTGTQLLAEASKVSPHSIRFLLTGYADLNAVIESINHGEVYRYLTKPWDAEQLKSIINEATEVSLMLEKRNNNLSKISLKEGEKLNLLVMFENEIIYKRFNEQFHDKFNIFWGKDVETTKHILETQPIAVVVSDIHFCQQKIVPIVNLLKQLAPDIIVLTVTEHLDSGDLIELINQGQIYRCLVRPVPVEVLGRSMHQAEEKHLELHNDPELQQRFQVEAINTENSEHKVEDKPVIGNLLDSIRKKFG